MKNKEKLQTENKNYLPVAVDVFARQCFHSFLELRSIVLIKLDRILQVQNLQHNGQLSKYKH